MQQTLQIIEVAIKKLKMATGIRATIKTLPDEVALQLQNGRLTPTNCTRNSYWKTNYTVPLKEQ